MITLCLGEKATITDLDHVLHPQKISLLRNFSLD